LLQQLPYDKDDDDHDDHDDRDVRGRELFEQKVTTEVRTCHSQLYLVILPSMTYPE
jgi:hypothetical protein